MDCKEIEKEVVGRGLTAPRINEDRILGLIKQVDYHVFPETCLTVCCLTLENGFTVTGETSFVSPESFNKDLGEHVAKDKAIGKVFELEAYLLKQRLFEGWK